MYDVEKESVGEGAGGIFFFLLFLFPVFFCFFCGYRIAAKGKNMISSHLFAYHSWSWAVWYVGGFQFYFLVLFFVIVLVVFLYKL
jgi:hypothetical protein